MLVRITICDGIFLRGDDLMLSYVFLKLTHLATICRRTRSVFALSLHVESTDSMITVPATFLK